MEYTDEEFEVILEILKGLEIITDNDEINQTEEYEKEKTKLLGNVSQNAPRLEPKILQYIDYRENLTTISNAEILKQKIYEKIAEILTNNQLREIAERKETGVLANILKDFRFQLEQNYAIDTLVITTQEPSFMSKYIAHPNINISEEARLNIWRALEKIKKERNLNEKLEPISDNTESRVLSTKITDEEKLAFSIYEGAQPEKDTGIRLLGRVRDSYRTINVMFFENFESEITRIYNDQKRILPEAILFPEELMETTLNLYSGMYKFGKTAQSSYLGYRVERLESMEEMEREGKTISNFSTSRENYSVNFAKQKMVLMEVYIQPGTPCAVLEDRAVLGDNYMFGDEDEVLVAPGCKFEIIEELPLTEFDESFGDSSAKAKATVVKKAKVKVSSPEKAEELTPEEKEDKTKKTEIYMDCDLREKAYRFLVYLIKQQESGKTKNQMYEEMPYDLVPAYLEWKEAFQTVLRYRMREISLELDKAFEEQRKTQYSPTDIIRLEGQTLESIEEVGLKTIDVEAKESRIESEEQNYD